jgi:alkylhydroperoxidase/carboxymuconolactone decarboxylase family protein YurZ
MVYETDGKLHAPVLPSDSHPLAEQPYQRGVLTPKFIELLSIGYDASFAHMNAPGRSRHIKGVLRLGATMEEIMEVLKLCVAAGIHNLK